MKRIALLLLCGALIGSAQEVRISRAALLKSERTMVSLRAGTIVDVLSRDEWTLTVRFNNHTGLIPASSLAPHALSEGKTSFGLSVKKSSSAGVDTANQTTEHGASPTSANRSATILASN